MNSNMSEPSLYITLPPSKLNDKKRAASHTGISYQLRVETLRGVFGLPARYDCSMLEG